MRIRSTISLLSFILLIFTIGCARRVPITYEQAIPNASVVIKTKSGKSFEGIVHKKQPSYLLLKENQYHDSLKKMHRNNIVQITGVNIVYDANGKIIPNQEIQQRQKNKNLIYYSLGGAGLSFGASFFVGSLIHRSIDDSTTDGRAALWTTTAIGTTVGALFFAKKGKNKDRFLAIEDIREERYNIAKKRVQKEQNKRKNVKNKLEKEKAEQKRQQEEIQKLKEKLKKQKKQN